jgi:hypothetical protein
MAKAKEIMVSVRGVLMSVTREDRAPECTDELIDQSIDGFTRLLELYDALVAIGRMPNGTASDEQIANAFAYAELIKVLHRQLFKHITVKMHMVEFHLPNNIARFRGVGDFLEDFMELDHQKRTADECRTRGIGSRLKAFESHVRQEERANNAAVQEQIALVNVSNTRKKRKTTLSETAQRSEDIKAEKTRRRLGLLTTPPLNFSLVPAEEIIIRYRMKNN